jgi:SAM-dependent methyltransferase
MLRKAPENSQAKEREGVILKVKKIAKSIVHRVTGNRAFYYNELRKVADAADKKTILELGSGFKTGEDYAYSAKHIFKDCAEFIQSDINPEFGHKIVDATTMKFKEEFDVVLCLNVLEHVFDFQKAVDNIRRSLKKDGVLYLAVPFCFPLHDEPGDFWRYTEHALRIILKDFNNVQIKHQRSRILPTGYFVTAKK